MTIDDIRRALARLVGRGANKQHTNGPAPMHRRPLPTPAPPRRRPATINIVINDRRRREIGGTQ